MKRVIVFINIIIFMFCMLPLSVYAGAKEDYEEAQELYLAAGACLAAYSDRMGKLACEYLEQESWKIQPYIQTSNKADARFLLAKKEFKDGSQPIYLLAVVGTETMKDIKTDFRVDKVYFAGHTPAEFAENAALSNIPETLPKVHRGFHLYVQAALTAETQEPIDGSKQLLSNLLLANENRKVYLVGHSLGGAAATLGGARLISMGVRPEQIKVITFGAPAVGNEAFCRQFELNLNLTRVVVDGDPVTGVLQKLVGGYKQFGREIHWEKTSKVQKEPHEMAEYLDLAIKNYYQKREKALQAGITNLPLWVLPTDSKPQICIAPIKNSLPDDLQAEFWYMQQALSDEYQRVLPGAVMAADKGQEVRLICQQAKEKGYKRLIIPEITGFRLKNEVNRYYITLHQTVYDTDTCTILDTASYSTNTYKLTPLEALIHDASNMNNKSAKWLVDLRE